MAIDKLVSLDAMLSAPAPVAAMTVSGVFAQIVNRHLAVAIAGVGTPEVVAEAAIQRTERLRAFAAARTPEVVAEAPQAEAHAEAPQAETEAPLAEADAPLAETSDEEEFEKLLREEAEAEAAAEAKKAKAEAEAEAKAKAEAEAAIEALASDAAKAVAAAKGKVAEAKAYAAKWPQAEASATATETAFALASALAEAVALAETVAEAEASAVKVTEALAEVERLRRKSQADADKARKAAPASAPASAPVDGEEPEGPINPAFAGLRGFLAPAPAPAEVEAPAPAEVEAPAPAEAPAEVEAPAPDPALPVISGLGDIPMPITIRADALIGAVLGALDSVTNGALREALTAPLPGTYREAVARAAAFGVILDGMAKGGKVTVLKTVTVGGRPVAQIAVAHIVEWRLRGSDIAVGGRARLREGKVALNGVDTPFAGILQFDREAVVVDDTELESTDFGFAAPTTSVVAVKRKAPAAQRPVAPAAPRPYTPAPKAAEGRTTPHVNRDGSGPADRALKGRQVIGYGR